MTSQISPRIEIFVMSIRGVPHEVLSKYPKGAKLYASSEVLGVRKETHALPASGALIGQEVSLSTQQGTLSWELSTESFRAYKAMNNTIKIELNIRHEESLKVLGNVIINTRDLALERKAGYLKIYGLKGAEMQISSKIHQVVTNTSAVLADMNLASDGPRASNESVQSVLRLGGENALRFQFYFRFEGCRNIEEFCKSFPAGSPSYFHWTIFGEQFRTESFDGMTQHPAGFADIVRLEGSKENLLAALRTDISPVSIFLSCAGTDVAVAQVFSSMLDSEKSLLLPITSVSKDTDGWFPLSSTSTGAVNTVLDMAGVKIAFTIQSDETDVAKGYNDVYVSDEEFEGEYLADCEKYVEPSPFSLPSSPVVKKAVSFGDTSGQTTPVGKHQKEDDEKVEKVSNLLPDDTNEEFVRRHYRLSFEVSSISSMRRAANLVVQFSYPHIDSTSPVRTRPMWVPTGADKVIDGACATYEFVRCRNDLQGIFLAHSLKVSAYSRSQAGYDHIGDSYVDLALLFESSPHSYRSPTDRRAIFQSLEQYGKYRLTLQALHTSSRPLPVPPKDPVVIRVVDSFQPIVNSPITSIAAGKSGSIEGKFRIKVVLEELSAVCGEAAYPIALGNQVHNAAVFSTSNQPSPASIDRTHRPDTGEFQHPSSSIDQLRLEWEEWRRAAESKWRENFRVKEIEQQKAVEQEAKAAIEERVRELRTAQEQAVLLEVRLRSALDNAGRQMMKLSAAEKDLNNRFAQKNAELQLMQRRIREEAKSNVEAETRRVFATERKLTDLRGAYDRLERRTKEAEKEFDEYRQQMRSTPESHLRDEVVKLRAQVADNNFLIEHERSKRASANLEKEEFKTQMYRLATALQREREKSSVVARQELEQLRLEFLAREERYVLDGDRDELRSIRHQLSNIAKQIREPASPDSVVRQATR